MNNNSVPTCMSCTNNCENAGKISNCTCWEHPLISKDSKEEEEANMDNEIDYKKEYETLLHQFIAEKEQQIINMEMEMQSQKVLMQKRKEIYCKDETGGLCSNSHGRRKHDSKVCFR